MENQFTNLDQKTLTKQIISYLETYIADEIILSSFIRDLKVFFVSNTELHIGIKTPYGKTLIENDYKIGFIAATKEILNKPLNPVFFVQDKYELNYDNFTNNENSLLQNKKSYINNNFTFDNFAITTYNKDVVDAGNVIIKEKAKFNPLFIFSSSGFGKTHFLHAIGNELIKKKKTVFYITSDRFTHEIKKSFYGTTVTIENLKNQYKNIDYLLIDDIQFLSNRPKTLDVLFDIFNSAIENKKQQIVLTSDKSPNELAFFPERFITRFDSGLKLELKKPTINDFEKIIRLKISLNKKLASKKWDSSAISFLARNNSSNVRGIESSISRIEFYLDTINEDIHISSSLLKEVFKDVIIDEKHITPDRILQIVSKYYNVSKSSIIGISRQQKYVLPRHMAMVLIKNINRISYEKIGNIFSNRDHSTVMSAIKKMENKKKINSSITTALSIIENQIRKMN